MRKIPLTHSIWFFWEDLIFLEASLRATELTEALAAGPAGLLTEFEQLLKSDMASRRALLQAYGRGAVTDVRIDLGLRAYQNDTLHLVGQDRQDPRYAMQFARGITALVRHALVRQVEVLGEVLDRLGLPIYTEEFRTAQQARLQPLLEQGQAAVSLVKQTTLGRAGVRLELREWKQEANTVRLAVYGQLLELAAQQRLGRDWAESFFARDEARPEPEADVTEPPPPGEPG